MIDQGRKIDWGHTSEDYAQYRPGPPDKFFDLEKTIAEMKRLLRPNGVLMISYFIWMPLISKIAYESERLILKYNPQWSAHSYGGYMPAIPTWAEKDFHLKGMFYSDEEISFTREMWMGRMRASRGIGASLSPEEIKQFDLEHEALLKKLAPENFTIPHRIGAHILKFKS